MTAGAVLCGGASRRMGTDKAMVEVNGTPMAERVARALAAGGCEPVAFIGGDRLVLARFARQVHADRWPGGGPVGGVLTALAELCDDVVVAACDLPHLDRGAVAAVLAAAAGEPHADVVVAETDRVEPLLAFWRFGALDAVAASWQAGTRALHQVIDGLVAVRVAVDADSLRNVNTPADLAAAEHPDG